MSYMTHLFEAAQTLPPRPAETTQKISIRATAPLAVPPEGDTSVHPVAVLIPVAAALWLVLVAWFAFGGGETSLALAVITTVGVIYVGLLLLLGKNAYRAGGAVATRSFRQFLQGTVALETGPVSGRQALVQAAAMPVLLAIGGTVIALCAMSFGF